MTRLILFKRKHLKGLECLNCLMPLRGDENFCPSCGQKNDVRKLRVSHFFTEFLAGFISYDSTLWRTLKPILLNPGKVPLEFIRGRRKRYVNPFRFYFMVSVIYFLVIGMGAKWDEINSINSGKSALNLSISENLTSAQEQELHAVFNDVDTVVSQDLIFPVIADSIPVQSKLIVGKNIERGLYLFKNNKTLSVEAALQELKIKPTFFYKVLFQKIRDYYVGDMEENVKTFLNYLVSNISIALFFLLPIFTLFVWLVYLRKKLSYMEHLVFVFNTQTVLFLLLLIFFCIDVIMGTENQWWLTFCLFSLYLLLALKGFYQQGLIKTLIKYFILNGIYFVLASIGFLFVSGLSFLFS